MGEAFTWRRYRAPSQPGQALIEPPLDQVSEQLAANRTAWQASGCELSGRRWSELAGRARQQLLERATAYTREYREVGFSSSDQPLVLAGHQPHLFHPGVWFKNFVLARLAGEHSAVAVNLLIDNDTLRDSSIRVPRRSPERVWQEHLAYDRQSGDVPYEDREILDESLFSSFGERAAAMLEPLVGRPLVREYWRRVRSASRRTRNVGRILAEARHQLEGEWGLRTLEVPLSSICEGHAFLDFAVHLMESGDRFRAVHNACLGHYRRRNHVRSHSHPVPELAAEDGWCESPFWIWSREEPVRRRVFVRRCGAQLQLTDRSRTRITLSLRAGDAEPAVSQLDSLQAQGLRLRPRALMTTMYARLLLGDYFLHGIGGAKYDQLTDKIIEQFFGIRPPSYMVVTATLLLPVPAPAASPDRLQHLQRQLRELKYQPERHVVGASAAPLVEEKRGWLMQPLPRGAGRERHHAIERINRSLQPLVREHRLRLEAELQRWERDRREQAILGSREYAFCLFPEETLRASLLELSRRAT